METGATPVLRHTRNKPRWFFDVDVQSTVIGTLYALAKKNLVEHSAAKPQPK